MEECVAMAKQNKTKKANVTTDIQCDHRLSKYITCIYHTKSLLSSSTELQNYYTKFFYFNVYKVFLICVHSHLHNNKSLKKLFKISFSSNMVGKNVQRIIC